MGASAVLQSDCPQPTEALLSALLEEMADIPTSFLLILEDYHCIEARPVADAIARTGDCDAPLGQVSGAPGSERRDGAYCVAATADTM